MLKNKQTVKMMAFLMFLNALGMSIIVPIMYPLSKTFGMPSYLLPLLIASFVIPQMLSTPIIGRLADKYNKKNILIFCIVGSAISYLIIPWSSSIYILFLSRIIDGITGGNSSIINSIVSDSSSKNNKLKNFTLISTSYSMGIFFGPAISGLLAQYNLALPFIVAFAISLIGIALLFNLKINNPKNNVSENFVQKENLNKNIKITLIIKVILILEFLLSANKFSLSSGFQIYNNDVFKLSVMHIAIIHAFISLIIIVSQQVILKYFTKYFKIKFIYFIWIFLGSGIIMFSIYKTCQFSYYLVLLSVYYIVMAIKEPKFNELISNSITNQNSSYIYGLNQSFSNLGQIIGLLLCSIIVYYDNSFAFILCAILLFISTLITIKYKKIDSEEPSINKN